MGLAACAQRRSHQLRRRSRCILCLLRRGSRQHGRVATLSACLQTCQKAAYTADAAVLLPFCLIHRMAGNPPPDSRY